MADPASKDGPLACRDDKRKSMEDRIQGAFRGGDFIPIPGTVSYHAQAKRDIEKGKKAEEAEGRGQVTMIANMNVSKSIADIERRAKAPRQTFETEAWYVSMQPGKSHGKAKDDDLDLER